MLSENYKIAVDASYENWAAISDAYRDAAKVGLGFAYEPDKDKQRTSLGRMPLRVGGYYRQLAFADKDGNDIDEMSLSCGVTMPLLSKVSRIDMGFQYVQRGNLSTNNLSDRSMFFLLGFTGFDFITKAKDNTAARDIPVKEEFE